MMKKFCVTLGVGLLAGTVLGLLTAPDSGCATRGKLARLCCKCGCCSGMQDNYDRDELEALRDTLEEQLNEVNRRLKA